MPTVGGVRYPYTAAGKAAARRAAARQKVSRSRRRRPVGGGVGAARPVSRPTWRPARRGMY